MRMLSRLQFRQPKAGPYASKTGQLFGVESYTDAHRPQRLQFEERERASKIKPAPAPEFAAWNRRYEPYVTMQRTLFDPGKYGRPEEDELTQRTRQQLFRQGWGQ